MKKIILALLIFLTSCGDQSGEQNMNPMTVKVTVGELGEHFLQRNNLPAKGHIDKQPAGLNFYEYDWSTKAPGAVMVEHGAHSFQIPFALGVVGTQDAGKTNSGIADFNVRAGISSADTIMHDEARKQFVILLQNLVKLGWKPAISYNYPRLTGELAFKYYLENDNYGIPINYSPTLDEWMKIKFGYWRFYVDNVFLKINFQRDRTKMNPNEPGAYLFVFELFSQEEFAKGNFQSDDREHWQELWVDKIKSLKKQRYEKEKELVKRGYTIFTDYEEPKIHPADPVEP